MNRRLFAGAPFAPIILSGPEPELIGDLFVPLTGAQLGCSSTPIGTLTSLESMQALADGSALASMRPVEAMSVRSVHYEFDSPKKEIVQEESDEDKDHIFASPDSPGINPYDLDDIEDLDPDSIHDVYDFADEVEHDD